ncbi:hypothetical protein [Pseudomonas oryzihabitans]|uniref:hypothetical protein n=1 Tax=Pseudomonas oryzihabitans TaxID=47885 RepID=UPI001120B095|nr:hypothetical protein [Pseudomonas psychrotolerans]
MRKKYKLSGLVEDSCSPLNGNVPVINDEMLSLAGRLADQLLEMLTIRNGFYTLENALHVFPSSSTEEEIGLHEWNDPQLWRNGYEDAVTNCLFFAEDVFGGQFCVKENNVLYLTRKRVL